MPLKKALARFLGQQDLNLVPSPERSRLVQLLQARAAQPQQSRSPIESLAIAARPVMAAALARQEANARNTQTAQNQKLLEQMLGVPQPAQVGLADPRTGEIEPRTVDRLLTDRDKTSRAIASLLAQNPGATSNVAASMLAQQLSGSTTDPFTLSPGQTRFDRSGRPIASLADDADIERVGQRVVNGNEMEIFRDKGTNQLFAQDAQGNRTVLGSSDLTTPIQRREQGAPGSFANPAARKEFDDFILGAVQSTRTIDGMLSQLDSADAESVVGIPGFVSRGLSSVTATAKGLADLAGGQAVKDGQIVPESELFNPDNFDFSAFGDRAGRSATFKSDAIQLAYSQARVFDPGGRLSDFDVQVQLDRLATGSGDPRQMRSALLNIRKQIGQSVQDRASFFQAQERITPEFQQLFSTAPTSSRADFVNPGDISAMDAETFEGFINDLTDEQLRAMPEDVLRTISQRMQ